MESENRGASATAFLQPILIILWIFLTGLFSFMGLFYLAPAFFPGFQQSLFLSTVYGITSFLGAAAIVFGYFKFVQKKREGGAFDFSQKTFQVNKEVLVHHITSKNRKSFYSDALFVAIFSLVSALIFWQVFGIYPNETFLMPSLWIYALIWFIFIQILPSMFIKIMVASFFVMRIVILVMGWTILLQFLPTMLMFPLFAVMNFLMMFGPLAIMNVMQIKKFLPGESRQDEDKEVKGQPQAMKQLEQALMLFASEEGEELEKIGGKAPRGVLMKGPPGVGKTLFAKKAATILSCPIVTTNGAAYMATFMGIDILVMLYTKWMVNGLAREWGRAVLFIDEADQLMMRRSGMQGGVPGVSGRAGEFWNMFSYDGNGNISSCGLSFINHHTQEIRELRQEILPRTHPQMFPGMFGGGGMSMAIFPYLAWLDGYGEIPFTKKLIRNKVNKFLDVILVIPPKWRIPPAKPEALKVLHLAATNRPQVMDPALLRTGRFGLHVEFRMPDGPAREDIYRFYLGKIKHWSGLAEEEKIKEFGRTSAGLSPADIEQVLRDAIMMRYTHVMRLKYLENKVKKGEKLDEKEEEDWERYKDEIGKENWDTIWVDWNSIVEALGNKRHGVAQPPKQVPKIRRVVQRNVGYHEIGGHLLPLKAFCASFEKPTFLSVVPRGEALGLVAHIPLEDRDDIYQWMIEGYLRVSVGSLAAERIFLEEHDNGPGVSSDLVNYTNIAFRMVSKWGMAPRTCKDKKEEKKYEEVGEFILSLPEMNEHSPALGSFSGISGFERKRRNFLIILGQAYVDSWRVIKKNKDLVPPIVENLVNKGEITGQDLEDLWDSLKVRPLDQGDNTDSNWPEMTFKNRFYVEAEK